MTWRNTIFCGDWIEMAKRLPDGCVHCIVTSPPYWGQRNYGVEGQLGLEKTFEEHIERLVIGFREMRRILRDDGVMFLNYGDKYATNNHTGEWGLSARNKESLRPPDNRRIPDSLQQGDLIGLAWRLALALQADGWILRNDVIWAKAVSFNDKYSGSTMPESLNGTRWERCRVKMKNTKWNEQTQSSAKELNKRDHIGNLELCPRTKYHDCPGCAKCEPNGGYVLRRGSWRPTRAHEYVFQFVKQIPYYADAEAVKEESVGPSNERPFGKKGNKDRNDQDRTWGETYGRNLRDVWTINPKPYKGAHYATFPPELVEPCIKAGTSQKGCCPACGAPWARIVEKRQVKRSRPNDRTDRHEQEEMNSCGNTVAGVKSTTIGWRATCGCEAGDPVPCVVYDPFVGSGTVPALAAKLGRNYCGSELSEDYLEHQARPRIRAAETSLDIDELDSQKALFS